MTEWTKHPHAADMEKVVHEALDNAVYNLELSEEPLEMADQVLRALIEKFDVAPKNDFHPMDITCVWCKAEPGEPCRTKWGRAPGAYHSYRKSIQTGARASSHIAKARELHNAYLTAKEPDIMFDRLELLLAALPDALDEAEVHERGRANAVRQLGEALDRADGSEANRGADAALSKWHEVIDLAHEVYAPVGVATWLASRNAGLDGCSPLTLLGAGEGDRVIALLTSLAEGNFA